MNMKKKNKTQMWKNGRTLRFAPSDAMAASDTTNERSGAGPIAVLRAFWSTEYPPNF